MIAVFEKNMHITFLLDFYGNVLADRTRELLEMYYLDDMSLSEIADSVGITRQGVRGGIKKGEEELQYLESVFDALTRAVTENDIIQLRLELQEQGYIRTVTKKGKPPKALPPLEYKSTDGFSILVGRNNVQNDKLSLKFAEKSDMWLHTQGITGSHVLICTDGATPPDKTIEEAAIIAAVNSKGRSSNLVPVDYCLAKYVKKPVGAKPRKVIFSNYSTAFVKPDAEFAESLKVK